MKSPLWYYQSGGSELGPVTTDELRFLARSGNIGPQTIVRAAGTSVGKPFAAAFHDAGPAPTPAPAHAPIAPRPAAVSTPTGNSRRPSAPQPPSLPPPLQQAPAGSTKPPLAITAIILALLLTLSLWWLWPRTPPGLAAAGTGTGTSAAGEHQTTDTQPSTAAAAAPTQPDASSSAPAPSAAAASAPAASNQSASASDTDAATAPGDTPADSAADSGTATTAPPTGDLGTAPGESATAANPSDPPTDGLVVGSRGDERFAISAPGETTFFGLRGQGRRFSWVVDCSGSMQGPPLERARQELLKSLRKLPQGLEFQVIFFDDLPYSYPAGGFAEMDPTSLAEAAAFISGIQGGGGTNVLQAMRQVFSQRTRPDTAFLLTDGEFDPETPEFIQSRNSGAKVRINTVAFVDRAGEPLLRRIASENRGDFRFVP